jgi:hypothetical protein
MRGLTDYITTQPWVDIFTTWYVLVDDAYPGLVTHMGRLRQRGPTPTFRDSEVITIALIADPCFPGNQEVWVRCMRHAHRDLVPHLVDATRFNRRRRARVGTTEAIRRVYTRWVLAPDDPVRVVDSAPMPGCTYMRSRSCATVAGAA